MSSSTQLLNQVSALNNSAVAMMLRGDFQSAVTTMENALFIMEIVSNGTASLSPDDILNFAQSKNTQATSLLSSVSKQDMSFSGLTAVDSDDFHSLKHASLSQQTSPFSFTAVLIREPKCAGQFSFTRESGIILYNHGLACYMLSLTDPNACFHGKSNEKVLPEETVSYRSLIYAHAAFSDILFKCNNATEDLESVFLSLLVLSSAGKVMRAQNEPAKAREAEQAMGTMLDAVSSKACVCIMEMEMNTAAAA